MLTDIPPQQQARQPGQQHEMNPAPISMFDTYRAAGKLQGKVAIVTGGDSGIGRAIVYHFAAEGAKIVFTHFHETEDAACVEQRLREMKTEYLVLEGDLGDQEFCRQVVERTVAKFHVINCVVNNAAEQHEAQHLSEISAAQMHQTFRTNFFSYFYLTQAALPHLHEGDTIINTASVTAYRGSARLVDYASTKGAIISFTRSLALQLAKQKIRVNAVAPGPVWTPLIPASFNAEAVSKFGEKIPLEHPAQPADIAPCYVFLASQDSSYFLGQVLHPNGGEIVNA
jgi:NAD(P)-dependent dehydrogenase (short-subunit alcohol dehydrogenase family)